MPASDNPLDGVNSASSAAQPKAKVSLTGVAETMLVTLTGRAQDAHKPNSILHDKWAAEVLSRLDYTYPPLPTDDGFFTMVLLRGRLFDVWTTDFLAKHPSATVLHLACGLDSRALRVPWGPGVRWIDVDVPEVVALRRQVLPDPSAADHAGAGGVAPDYRLVAANVTDDAWLKDVPADRPTLVVMEGLLMYLSSAEMNRLLERLCARFPDGGQIIFDHIGWLGLRSFKWNRQIKRTGAVFTSSLDHASEVEAMHPKMTAAQAYNWWSIPGLTHLPLRFRVFFWIFRWIPGLRTSGSYMLFNF